MVNKVLVVISVILLSALLVSAVAAQPCSVLNRNGDFNNDGFVDTADFAYFAIRWLDLSCSESDWCDCVDLDISGGVETEDLKAFSDRWLKAILDGTIILGRPSDDSVTVNVISNEELDIYFEYGTSSGLYCFQTDVNSIQAGTAFEKVIDNLQADTRYFYRMCFRATSETEFGKGPEYSFHTQRVSGSDFVFDVQADSHIYDHKCNSSLYQITIQNEHKDAPDFVIDLGDTFGDDHDVNISYEEIVQLHLDQRPYFGFVCHSAPLFLCLGNHEGECGAYMDGTPDNLAIYATKTRKLYYPNPYPDGGFYTGNTTVEEFVGLPENYYAWEWGDALFVVLDAYRYITTDPKPKDQWEWSLGEVQYNWFKQTLEQSNATFKFVFAHHVLGQCRGAVAWADKYEWGGNNKDGTWGFDEQRPGWSMPIHQLMVQNGVTIYFQGHDHLFAKEELDGIVYQEAPMPSDATYHVGDKNADDYTGDVLCNSGHLRVTVADPNVTVEYIRAFLPEDQNDTQVNGGVAYSYIITK